MRLSDNQLQVRVRVQRYTRGLRQADKRRRSLLAGNEVRRLMRESFRPGEYLDTSITNYEANIGYQEVI